jgi:hypothetical protein
MTELALLFVIMAFIVDCGVKKIAMRQDALERAFAELSKKTKA